MCKWTIDTTQIHLTHILDFGLPLAFMHNGALGSGIHHLELTKLTSGLFDLVSSLHGRLLTPRPKER